MTAALIDSDVLIEVARGRNANVLSRWQELSESDAVIACSPVTVAEIWHGARPAEYTLLGELFEALTCIPVDVEIGRRAGEYLRSYAKSHRVKLGDALIAATASVRRTALWTLNRKRYPMPDVVFL